MQKEIKEMLRFILVISIGFGVGGGLFACMAVIWDYIFYFHNPLNEYILRIILFTAWGALGGLAIGITAKKDKKLYMLLGGIGLGAGFVVTSPWNVSGGIGGMGAFIGILEGISLGYYYKKAKFIGILAACGAFGFGLGSIIEISMLVSEYIVPIPVIRIGIGIIMLTIIGLIGGASLGYGIYYIKKISS